MQIIELFPSREVAVTIINWPIYWYGLMYFLGFVLGFYVVQNLQKFRDINLSKDQWSTILSWIVIGVLVGGRLGYVLLYEPAYYLQNPLQVFAVWKGGMASHGGFFAVICVLLYLSKTFKISLLAFADIIVIPIAIGLALGRLGNFINLELYGSPTDVPWAIAIPGVEDLRHPTQLYAVCKNVFVASICYTVLIHKRSKVGDVTGTFLVTYSVARFIVEFYRVPTHSTFALFGAQITRGQLYSIPIFLLGICIFFIAKKIHQKSLSV